MTKRTKKLTTLALLGLGLHATYGMEDPTKQPDNSLLSNPSIYFGFNHDFQTYEARHEGTEECIPKDLQDVINEIRPTSLLLECPKAKNINLSALPLNRLENLDIRTLGFREAPHYNNPDHKKSENNLNSSLAALKNAENLERLTVRADNLSPEGVAHIADIPHLKVAEMNTYYPNDKLLLLLDWNRSLDCLYHSVQGYSQNRKALDYLNDLREQNNLPEIPNCWDRAFKPTRHSLSFREDAFVRYSEDESIGNFTYSPKNNMRNQDLFRTETEIKSMFLEHSDENNCFPQEIADVINSMLPDLVELTVMCPYAEEINFTRIRSEKLRTLIVNTEAANLNRSLGGVRNTMPNIENMTIHSNQLSIVGISQIALLEKLKEFTCSTHRYALNDHDLLPLAHMKSLERVNYGSWENTGGYTALIALHEESQKIGRAPLKLGDTRTGDIYNFDGCKIPLGEGFTLFMPGKPVTPENE